jgi:hypothetical protein
MGLPRSPDPAHSFGRNECLTVENRGVIVLMICKKLAHFGAPPISEAKEIDNICEKSLYYQDLSKKRP